MIANISIPVIKPSSAIYDKYPEKMKETVELLQDLINRSCYELLTQDGWGAQTIHFPDVPGWIVKGAESEIINDICEFVLKGIVCNRHSVSNFDGSVYCGTFSLAARVTTAKKMRTIIKINQLKMIVIPKKYLCSYSNKLNRFKGRSSNTRYFVLAEKCDAENKGLSTFRKNLSLLNDEEKIQLGKELVVFLRHSGVIDFQFRNFYLKDKKWVLFDTEPMSLTLSSRCFSVSVPLTEAKVNYENVRINLETIPGAEIIVKKCIKAKKNVHLQELSIVTKFIQTVALFILGISSPFLIG